MGREIVSIATALVPYPPERVWAVVTDLDCWQWRSDLSRLDHVGEDAFTEYDRSGFPTRFTVTVLASSKISHSSPSFFPSI